MVSLLLRGVRLLVGSQLLLEQFLLVPRLHLLLWGGWRFCPLLCLGLLLALGGRGEAALGLLGYERMRFQSSLLFGWRQERQRRAFVQAYIGERRGQRTRPCLALGLLELLSTLLACLLGEPLRPCSGLRCLEAALADLLLDDRLVRVASLHIISLWPFRLLQLLIQSDQGLRLQWLFTYHGRLLEQYFQLSWRPLQSEHCFFTLHDTGSLRLNVHRVEVLAVLFSVPIGLVGEVALLFHRCQGL